jgi:hypothetical protein
MRLKIISDGTQLGTKIINEETGDIVDNCVRLKFEIDMDKKLSNVELTLIKIPIEYIGEGILYTDELTIPSDKPLSTEHKLRIFDKIMKDADS